MYRMNLLKRLLPLTMAFGYTVGCGSAESQLNDWALNDTYYYKVDTSVSPQVISQGKCSNEANSPVDISYSGCKNEFVKKDYNTFKTWIAKEISDTLLKLNEEKTHFTTSYDLLTAQHTKMSELIKRRASFAAAIATGETQIQNVDAQIEKNPLDGDLIAQRDIIFGRLQQNQKSHGSIKTEIFELKGKIITDHAAISTIDDDMKQLTALLEAKTKHLAENQASLDKSNEENSILKDVLSKLEGQGIPYQAKSDSNLYKKFQGVVSRFPSFFKDQITGPKNYSIELLNENYSNYYLVKSLSVTTSSESELVDYLRTELGKVSATSLQPVDSFRINGELFLTKDLSITGYNLSLTEILVLKIQKALEK